MQGQEPGTNRFCIYRDCKDLALFGDYCKKHQFQRAEAAEARAVAKSDLIDSILVTWELMTARLIGAEAERDEARMELQRIRTMLDDGTGEDDDTALDMVKRMHTQCYELRTKLNEALAIARGFVAERDELRRQLEQAHRKIDALATQLGQVMKA